MKWKPWRRIKLLPLPWKKKKEGLSWDDISMPFREKLQREAMQRMAWEIQLKEACRNGFYCIACRQPFQDIGIAIVCDCPIGTIRSPIIYTEDLEPDVKKILDDEFRNIP